MFSCFKKNEIFLLRDVSCLTARPDTRLYMPQKLEMYGFFSQFFESFRGKIYKKYLPREMKNGLSLRQ